MDLVENSYKRYVELRSSRNLARRRRELFCPTLPSWTKERFAAARFAKVWTRAAAITKLLFPRPRIFSNANITSFSASMIAIIFLERHAARSAAQTTKTSSYTLAGTRIRSLCFLPISPIDDGNGRALQWAGSRINFCTRQFNISATYNSFSDGHAIS